MLVYTHFIFDGPSYLKVKQGGVVKTAPHFLMQHFQELLTAFGFSWHQVHTITLCIEAWQVLTVTFIGSR
ncbi:hypothetical protein ID866_10494 [Astraeus odoratus]|nr:hypothetical protein ID866_10494 [Astraeus odoratus]